MPASAPAPALALEHQTAVATGRGIACALVAWLLFACMDAGSKLLAEQYSIVQILWVRFLSLLAVSGWLAARHGSGGLITRHFWLQSLRSFMLMVEIGLFPSRRRCRSRARVPAHPAARRTSRRHGRPAFASGRGVHRQTSPDRGRSPGLASREGATPRVRTAIVEAVKMAARLHLLAPGAVPELPTHARMLAELAAAADHVIVSMGIETGYHRARRHLRTRLVGGSADGLCYEPLDAFQPQLTAAFDVLARRWILPGLSQEMIFLLRSRA